MKTYKTNLKELTLKRNPTDFKRVKITSSKDSETYLRNFYLDDLTIYESFFLLLLNNQNNTIGYAKISQGGITGIVEGQFEQLNNYEIDMASKWSFAKNKALQICECPVCEEPIVV